MENLLTKPLLLFTLGTIMIGLGGYLTTKGWNASNEDDQRKALLRGVGHEWLANQAVLTREPLFNVEQLDSVGARKLYPRLNSEALRALVVSGLFSVSRSTDRELLRLAVDNSEFIRDFNARLEASDQYSLRGAATKDVRRHRKHVLSSVGFQQFCKHHGSLGEYLTSEYKWVLEDNFFDDLAGLPVDSQ